MCFQSLTEQEKSLQKQKEEQQERVKAVAPDKAKLKELEKMVEENRKGIFIAICSYSSTKDIVHENSFGTSRHGV